MTLTTERTTSTVLPDVTPTEKEKDSVIRLAAANDETPVVPGSATGERRAWSQPSLENNRLERD